ncbi:hypothetical protein [Nocardia donostiensis]|uniref:Uncharacterized protein n=1 Tax=Nocardia donostiensis TaxID=1538463 RepID=A0A1W0B5D6_9NOCA|nr:hypothetical protein [Nocardia donostiensis]ONM47883.1 hypothetical protein B0T46_14645 [Nocardia donostiensis]OQS16339.1 hypothetical protein B0T36_06190 [Nocardia donostiensis]OQS17720.1 hypothetical protein B0T44_23355 [Nocardia donostiensis]
MTFEEFRDEYHQIMAAVAAKEKKGGLDPDHRENYRAVTDEEQALLERDWKAFSRSRGFSEEDITEYERWLELSGQKQELPGAVNDPWRRTHTWKQPGGWETALYLRHVEARMARDGAGTLPPEVLDSYEIAKSERARQAPRLYGGSGPDTAPDTASPTPSTPDESTPDDEDVW